MYPNKETGVLNILEISSKGPEEIFYIEFFINL